MEAGKGGGGGYIDPRPKHVTDRERNVGEREKIAKKEKRKGKKSDVFFKK